MFNSIDLSRGKNITKCNMIKSQYFRGESKIIFKKYLGPALLGILRNTKWTNYNENILTPVSGYYSNRVAYSFLISHDGHNLY